MASVGNTANRTNAADLAASQNYKTPGAAIAVAQIKVDNLIAQLKVLRKWLNNCGDIYIFPTGNVSGVSFPQNWFSVPDAANPQYLPDSGLPWTPVTNLKQAKLYMQNGMYYVFYSTFAKKFAIGGDGYILKKADIEDGIAKWQKKLTAAQSALDKLKGTPAGATPSSAKPTAPTNTGQFATKADLDAQDVVTNVGSVREAYFSHHVGSGAPGPITDAAQLWLDQPASKGMLQTYFPPGGYDDAKSDSSQAFDKAYELTKYGFQFMYNPTTISMDYFSTQNVDVAFMMSGQDKFNYVPSTGNSGAITFQILINRIFDMQYYEPNGVGGGKLKDGAEMHYFPRAPYGSEYAKSNKNAMDEQSAIYNKGTMYDIEYLLRTILGFKMKSAMRREFTADMGFFSRKMVDLHLGPKMRYRGYVNSLHVDHAMFNERMVPTLSRVSITFNRFPDYPTVGAGLPGTNDTTAPTGDVTATKTAADMAAAINYGTK